MKWFKFAIPVILMTVVLAGAMFLCTYDKTEKKSNLFFHYYSIEPESLLDALGGGNTNVFIPIPDEPASIPSDQQITVSWTQDDYYRIAKALYKYARGDTLDGWQLNSMDFSLGCEESGRGFQDGNFRFFKIVKTSEGESRVAVIININPGAKYVLITENQFDPKMVNWSSIDLNQEHPSADEILQIAENAGGKEKRLAVENACHISLLLSPDSADYEGWFVHYQQGGDVLDLFEITIDPVSGEIRSS